jgi:hypothetical protein
MKRTLFLLLSLFFFVGCSHKVDINTLSIPNDLIQSKYSTYDPQENKITIYYFKNKEGVLHVRDSITYVPIDSYGDMYDPFSPLKWDLDRISNEKTLEEALEFETAKNFYKKLFLHKNEYIIDNDFAFEITRMIKEYNDRIQRRNDSGRFGLFLLFKL